MRDHFDDVALADEVCLGASGSHPSHPERPGTSRQQKTRADRKQPRPLGLMFAADLMAKKLPAIRYIVPGYLSEGLTLIGGKAKLAKSWLLLGIAIAVSTGGVALNSIPVDQSDVLYLALEDNERRSQKRLGQLLPNGDAPGRLSIDIAAPRLDDGLLELLRAWIEQAADPRLVIVDVLNRVRLKQGGQEGIYDYDVRYLEGMQSLAAEYGIAKHGFIALKFNDPGLDPFVRDVVKPTIKASIGFDVVDLRNVARAGIIDNLVREQIRDSAFVLVDLTHDNSGAYREAGYAEGLGKPVIYLCEKTKFDEAKTHFYTNQCTTAIWTTQDIDGFQKQLISKLRRSLYLFGQA